MSRVLREIIVEARILYGELSSMAIFETAGIGAPISESEEEMAEKTLSK